MTRSVITAILAPALFLALGGPAVEPRDLVSSPRVQQSEVTFRGGVDLVSIAATVRDRRGRLVRDLTRQDFTVIDGGVERPIREFRAEEHAALSVALLIDVSGSMRMGGRMGEARAAARAVLARLMLDDGQDEAAVFAFDVALEELEPFSRDAARLSRALERVEPFGSTALFDAIADGARQTAGRGGARRAVIVFTDGVDTASRRTAAEVSGIASGIDVPVYVVALMSPRDRRAESLAPEAALESGSGTLAHLAWWTGGDIHIVSSALEAEETAQRIVNELRHQYLIGFESAAEPGWRPLDIRTRDSRLTVRARSGYFAGQARSTG